MMIYILRRLNGLKNFKSVNDITTHYSNSQNGQTVETESYKGKHLPGATTSIGISWDALEDKYFFEGEDSDLDRIVEAFKLKYEDGNEKGSLIKTANLRDINDPFFSHSSFHGKYLCIEGELLLNDEIPAEELLVRSLKVNRKVINRTREGYHSVGAEWELLSPLKEEADTATDNDSKLKAFNILSDKTKELLQMIAFILGVDYDENIEHSAKNNLFKAIEKNKTTKLGGRFVDKFIELATGGKDSLIPLFNVRKAEFNGLLSFNGSYYQFKAVNTKAETTINVRSVNELVSYFDKNPEQMQILIAENENR